MNNYKKLYLILALFIGCNVGAQSTLKQNMKKLWHNKDELATYALITACCGYASYQTDCNLLKIGFAAAASLPTASLFVSDSFLKKVSITNGFKHIFHFTKKIPLIGKLFVCENKQCIGVCSNCKVRKLVPLLPIAITPFIVSQVIADKLRMKNIQTVDSIVINNLPSTRENNNENGNDATTPVVQAEPETKQQEDENLVPTTRPEQNDNEELDPEQEKLNQERELAAIMGGWQQALDRENRGNLQPVLPAGQRPQELLSAILQGKELKKVPDNERGDYKNRPRQQSAPNGIFGAISGALDARRKKIDGPQPNVSDEDGDDSSEDDWS